jgi:hypothetical protein
MDPTKWSQGEVIIKLLETIFLLRKHHGNIKRNKRGCCTGSMEKSR